MNSNDQEGAIAAASPVNTNMQVAQPRQPQRPQHLRKRKIVVDLSSLPLQIMLCLNVYFFMFYWVAELLLYVYKGMHSFKSIEVLVVWFSLWMEHQYFSHPIAQQLSQRTGCCP